MDHLEVETFSVMGWSMGGRYAAAAAVAMPTRVRRLAIIAGALPLTEPGVFAQLPAFDRMYTRLSQAAPWLDRMCFRTMHSAAASRARTSTVGWPPQVWGRSMGRCCATRGYAVFAAMSAEAFRQPEGVVEDYRAWARPWGFGRSRSPSPPMCGPARTTNWSRSAGNRTRPAHPRRHAARPAGRTLPGPPALPGDLRRLTG